jgi:transposase-like protein
MDVSLHNDGYIISPAKYVTILITAKRGPDVAKRIFRKMLQEQPLLAPDRIGTDAAGLQSGGRFLLNAAHMQESSPEGTAKWGGY